MGGEESGGKKWDTGWDRERGMVRNEEGWTCLKIWERREGEGEGEGAVRHVMAVPGGQYQGGSREVVIR